MIERRFSEFKRRVGEGIREMRMSRLEKIDAQLGKMVELVRPNILSGTELDEDVRKKALGIATSIWSSDQSLDASLIIRFRLLHLGVENPQTRAIIRDLFREVAARDIARIEERKTGTRVDWRDIKRAIDDTNPS